MIEYAVRDRVAMLTLNRPARRNALGTEMIEGFDHKLTELNRDPNVGAVVVAGAPPSFCAGSDLKELADLDLAGMVDHEDASAAVARRIGLIGKPFVAAVEGHAIGGGFLLALSCDLVVTSAEARWSLPEVPNGWLPPWGLKALVNRVGAHTARRLAWGYEVLDGQEALRLGLADYCVPAGGAAARAMELAQRLAALPAEAVGATKQFFEELLSGDAEAWDARACRVFADNCGNETSRETLKRFRAKG